MWFSKGTSILIETLVQPQTNRVKEQKHCIFIKNGLSLCWVTGQPMSLFQENIFFFSSESLFLFSSSVYSKRCFPDQERLLGVLTGQENIFLPSSSPSLFLFSSTVYSRRCFLWPRNGKSTTVNNCQWSRHRLQTERTRLKLSFEWPILHHGGKYLSQKMSISRLWDCLI